MPVASYENIHIDADNIFVIIRKEKELLKAIQKIESSRKTIRTLQHATVCER